MAGSAPAEAALCGFSPQWRISTRCTGAGIRGGMPLTEYMQLGLRYGLNFDEVTLDRSTFFTDPDGIRLEIYAPAGADTAPAPTPGAPTCGFF